MGKMTKKKTGLKLVMVNVMTLVVLTHYTGVIINAFRLQLKLKCLRRATL